MKRIKIVISSLIIAIGLISTLFWLTTFLQFNNCLEYIMNNVGINYEQTIKQYPFFGKALELLDERTIRNDILKEHEYDNSVLSYIVINEFSEEIQRHILLGIIFVILGLSIMLMKTSKSKSCHKAILISQFVCTSIIIILLMLLLRSWHKSHYRLPAYLRTQYGGPQKMSFNGYSRELEHTEIVPTLDTPIVRGNNVIWCASFVAAWKKIQNELLHEPVWLKGAETTCERLNDTTVPFGIFPDNSYYSAVGWVHKGIIERIHSEMKTSFPDKSIPSFPGILDSSFLAYSYLQTYIPFTIPYCQNQDPLIFIDGSGNKTKIHSFGILQEDVYSYNNLREQSEVLFRSYNSNNEITEFAIDLCCNSQPCQIIIACIEWDETLSAIISTLDKKIAQKSIQSSESGFGRQDVLLIPNIFWAINHEFEELKNREFTNSTMFGQRMDVVSQDVMFKLDKSGAEIKSEVSIYTLGIDKPNHYIISRPFLILIRKRMVEHPFFVMWVDNAELLQRWN